MCQPGPTLGIPALANVSRHDWPGSVAAPIVLPSPSSQQHIELAFWHASRPSVPAEQRAEREGEVSRAADGPAAQRFGRAGSDHVGNRAYETRRMIQRTLAEPVAARARAVERLVMLGVVQVDVSMAAAEPEDVSVGRKRVSPRARLRPKVLGQCDVILEQQCHRESTTAHVLVRDEVLERQREHARGQVAVLTLHLDEARTRVRRELHDSLPIGTEHPSDVDRPRRDQPRLQHAPSVHEPGVVHDISWQRCCRRCRRRPPSRLMSGQAAARMR
eukprot:5586294-Prymnesium_polylepis.2